MPAFVESSTINIGTYNDVGNDQHNYHIQVGSLESCLCTARNISSKVEEVQSSQAQLRALGKYINTFLAVLDTEYGSERLSRDISPVLKNLNVLLDDIYAFVTVQQGTATDLASSVSQDYRIAQIADYHGQLEACLVSFQTSPLVNVCDWQRQNNEARVQDQNDLHKRLNNFASNQGYLKELLSPQNYRPETMLVSMMGAIEKHSGIQELGFFSSWGK